MSSFLESVGLSEEEDSWISSPDSDGLFSVKSTYNLLAHVILNEVNLELDKAFVFHSL